MGLGLVCNRCLSGRGGRREARDNAAGRPVLQYDLQAAPPLPADAELQEFRLVIRLAHCRPPGPQPDPQLRRLRPGRRRPALGFVGNGNPEGAGPPDAAFPERVAQSLFQADRTNRNELRGVRRQGALDVSACLVQLVLRPRCPQIRRQPPRPCGTARAASADRRGSLGRRGFSEPAV